MVLTNPPFGKKSSITVVNEEGDTDKETLTYNRPDFWTTTSNKQLNFVQHVKSLLKIQGRAAVVVPDHVLFEGGAGEVVRRKLLHECVGQPRHRGERDRLTPTPRAGTGARRRRPAGR